MQAESRMQRAVRNTIIVLAALVAFEGVISYLLFCYSVITAHPVAERRHTQYDPELGWVHQPNVHVPDMYGPGLSLRTNSQGFRAAYDFDTAVAPGKLRIICSGDSFTLGYGVGTSQTWCDLLAARDARVETVNMGQGGYGLDQIYLWYRRDGIKLAHDLHLLAIVTEDVQRMQTDTFLGYSKPVLDLDGGALVVRNVPVPKHGYVLSRLLSVTRQARNLRTAALSARMAKMVGVNPTMGGTGAGEHNPKTRTIVRKILEELHGINLEKSSRLAVVYLPLLSELESDATRHWPEVLEAEAHALGIPFVDVLEAFRSLTYGDAIDMFIPEGRVAYPGAAGHLSLRGNQFVAELIAQALATHPVLARTAAEATAQ
jgi:hypothetical protein